MMYEGDIKSLAMLASLGSGYSTWAGTVFTVLEPNKRSAITKFGTGAVCCELAALRFLFAGSYGSAGIVQLKWGPSDGLTQGKQVSFLSIYDEVGPLFPR